ncbi:hypothetical protein AB2828_05420 [Acinetobacter baumannii]
MSQLTHYLNTYIYPTLSDERIITQILGYSFDLNFVEDTLVQHHDQELAFHSIITKYGKTFHIPMIDFSTDNLNIDVYYIKKILLIIKFYLIWFFIPAATHFTVILPSYSTHKEWLSLALLLLVNPPHSSNNIIDTR